MAKPAEGLPVRRYLPQMRNDVATVRKIYKRLGAEPLFEQHNLRVLDYSIKETIVTASEVENPKEKLNRRLALLIMCSSISSPSFLPLSIRSQISGDMADCLAFEALDLDPRRNWADYTKLLLKPDGSLPLAVLAALAEKALYRETVPPSFYGVTQQTAPGVRIRADWGRDRKMAAEADLVVWRKIANILGYRDAYNRIGAGALEYTDEFAGILKEVRTEKARLAPAIRRTEDSVRRLVSGVCDELTRCGIGYKVEMRGEKGEASHALKLRKYRDKGESYNTTVVETNDNVAVKVIIKRKEGAMTENLSGVRVAENLLFDQAALLKTAGVFPYLDVRPKYYIQEPKPNGYRGDHYDFQLVAAGDTDPKHVNVEIQVLTEEMDDFNRRGGAAHIAYKDANAYESVAGVKGIRSALLENYRQLLDDLRGMQGKKGGSARFAELPRAASARTRNKVVILVSKFEGSVEMLEVSCQDGDRALDVLARSGLDIRNHAIGGGRKLSDKVAPGQTMDVLQRPNAVDPLLAGAIHASGVPYKQFTRNKLAEISQAARAPVKKSVKKKRR